MIVLDGVMKAVLIMFLCVCYSAVANEDVELLKCYSLAGADLNQGDYDKRTALHLVGKTIKHAMEDRTCSLSDSKTCMI